MEFKKIKSLKSALNFIFPRKYFGHRNLEEEAKLMSLKMERQGRMSKIRTSLAANLSKEELEIAEKDRTPG